MSRGGEKGEGEGEESTMYCFLLYQPHQKKNEEKMPALIDYLLNETLITFFLFAYLYIL